MKRALRVSLLIFQALWLNVLLPGHTRGVIVTPGNGSALAGQSTCCRPSDAGSKDGQKSPADPARRAAHCAICFFAAHMTVAAAVDLTPPPLGLIDTLSPASPTIVHQAAFVSTCLERGPPRV